MQTVANLFYDDLLLKKCSSSNDIKIAILILFAVYGINAWQSGPNTDQQTEQGCELLQQTNFMA